MNLWSGRLTQLDGTGWLEKRWNTFLGQGTAPQEKDRALAGAAGTR